MASFNGEVGIAALAEAHVTFGFADIGRRHASCFTAIIFVKAPEPIAVGAIFTLALEAAIPAVVVGVTGSFPTTEIIEAHIVLALLMVVTDHILAVPVVCRVVWSSNIWCKTKTEEVSSHIYVMQNSL